MKRNESGQALVEVAVFFMLFSVLMAAFCSFTKWMLVRERILAGTQEAALLYSSGHLTRDVVDREVKYFLTNGTPAIPSDHIQIIYATPDGFWPWFYELDKVTVRYTRDRDWYWLLGFGRVIEESCVIKHAPHYWAPIQPWGGPSVPWKG
jgi:hypothetical protein